MSPDNEKYHKIIPDEWLEKHRHDHSQEEIDALSIIISTPKGEKIHEFGKNVVILTKGGSLARRDFALYKPGDTFGTTLTCLAEFQSLKWEPGAAPPLDRINNLRKAQDFGYTTWVSLEPVIYLEQTLQLIHMTHEFVDLYKVGKMNYHPHAGMMDWKRVAGEVMELLSKLGCRFYLKKDLAAYLGHPEGIEKL